MDLHVIEWLSVTTLGTGLIYAIFIACSNLKWLPYQPNNYFGAPPDWQSISLSKNTRLLLNIAIIVIASPLLSFVSPSLPILSLMTVNAVYMMPLPILGIAGIQYII
ncbi:hypothetical protein [Psychromonas sp. Urea-02u-13]|uniref:hypothetical protein n=1 Tax=Psychromonas sp. Urea-02u-13 TaxID=2058326 RepID=UPI000C320B28|nr:hypothetical protein [Psychromonas sp. Urea-02u-13]PKG39413.1 hypothetical protein CXF74_08230 [Psychromonas sp. Urea-02u-13]